MQQIAATDDDTGVNGEVQYMLLNDTDFAIDPLTAEVESLRSFDFEMEKSFVLTVVAYDNATMNSMADMAPLIINISDINDNSPFFVAIPSNLSFPENIQVGDFIANVTAIDFDATSNAQVRTDCSMVQQGNILLSVIVGLSTG